MPQDRPKYSKLIYIIDAYVVRQKQVDLLAWLHQKLRYEGLPSWSGIDAQYGGGGFEKNSIECADPVIIVLSSGTYLESTIDLALAESKNIVLALTDDVKIPHQLRKLEIFDFRTRQEATYLNLVEFLNLNDYPKLIDHQGDFHLNSLEDYLRYNSLEKYVRKEEDLKQESWMGGSFNYPLYCYTKALGDMLRPHVRARAIQGLGDLRFPDGAIRAALTSDPSPDVRSEAALALASIGEDEYRHDLISATLMDREILVRLSAQIALFMYDNPSSIINALENLLINSTEPELNRALLLIKPRVNDLVKLSPNTPKQIFISYARRDSDQFALGLSKKLRESGFVVWIDEDLEPGSPVWKREVEKAIRQSAICLVILSPAVHDSEWIPREIQYARDFKKAILPIKYIETQRPLDLATDQGLREDLPFREHHEKMFQSLIAALERKVGRNTP